MSDNLSDRVRELARDGDIEALVSIMHKQVALNTALEVRIAELQAEIELLSEQLVKQQNWYVGLLEAKEEGK